MRYCFCIACLLFLQTTLFCQETNKVNPGKITGKVTDSLSAQPIDYATISVFKDGSDKPVGGATTNAKGYFSIDNLGAGNYRILIEFVGYKSKEKKNIVISSKNPEVNSGNFLLSASRQNLASVTVVAQKGLVENKIDKMVYNAEKDITSQSGVATDVLKKVPMVSVDVDGNVELQGNSNIRFLINGKPSSIFGNNLTDALQAIPASQIKSIEVITSPGAKYDAEGTGGIINIILKESKVRGINGNINLSAGSRLENGSFNMNARDNNFGAHAYFSGNAQLRSTTKNSLNRLSTDTSAKTNNRLTQDGSSNFTRNGFETGFGFDWDINKKNNLSGSVGYDNFGNNSNGSFNQSQIQYDTAGNIVSTFPGITRSKNHFRGQSTDWSLDYKKTFDKEDQELDVLFQSSYGHNKSAFNQDQSALPADSLFAGSSGSNTGFDHETSLQFDYTQPVNEKIKLEAGAKMDIRKITSNSDVYALNAGTGNYNYDSAQSNALDYTRKIYAGYASITFPLFDFLDIKSGLRYEKTVTDANFSKAPATEVPGYGTFAPSIVISHKFDEQQTIKVSYSRRINRPGYRFLNPYVNASDPKNITTGNPYLQPEIGDHFELGYLKSFEKAGTLNLNFFYHRSNQDIQPYVVYHPTYQIGDSVYTNVSVNTFENIGVENNYGLNIYESMPITPKLNARANLSFFYRHIVNRFIPGTGSSSFNYRVNMNVTYQFNGDFIMELFGNFNSPRNEVQGRFPSFFSYNFAFRKQFWQKKGSFGFTTTNPFNQYVNQQTAINGQDFTLNSTRKIPYRSFGVSFTYKFGKLKFKKEKEEKTDLPEDMN